MRVVHTHTHTSTHTRTHTHVRILRSIPHGSDTLGRAEEIEIRGDAAAMAIASTAVWTSRRSPRPPSSTTTTDVSGDGSIHIPRGADAPSSCQRRAARPPVGSWERRRFPALRRRGRGAEPSRPASSSSFRASASSPSLPSFRRRPPPGNCTASRAWFFGWVLIPSVACVSACLRTDLQPLFGQVRHGILKRRERSIQYYSSTYRSGFLLPPAAAQGLVLRVPYVLKFAEAAVPGSFFLRVSFCVRSNWKSRGVKAQKETLKKELMVGPT